LVKSAKGSGSLVGFIGGPPCPDFSVGGKNRGQHGENGKLSQAYVKLICELKPDFFLFENVKGLWRTKRHRAFFEEMKLLLWNAGYKTSERLINCINYGVPQDRERIILLGFRDSVPAAEPFRFGGLSNFFPWNKYAQYPASNVFSLPWPGTSPFAADSIIEKPYGVPASLTVQHWFDTNDVTQHPNSIHCFTPRAGLSRFLSVDEGDDSKKCYKRLHRWRYSPTACYGNNEVHLHPYKARRINVAEALATQSAPKRFELPANMTLSNMFKTVGNGVPVLAAEAVAKSVRDFLEENAENNACPDIESYQPAPQESCVHVY
jgi:DNA (cytosine-5)-methyltransferase 1